MNTYTFVAFLGGGFSGGEILVVFVAILMLFGSKNVPQIARTIGKSLEEFKKASRSVKDEIMRSDIKNETPPLKLPPEKDDFPEENEQPVEEADAPTPKVSDHAVQRDKD